MNPTQLWRSESATAQSLKSNRKEWGRTGAPTFFGSEVNNVIKAVIFDLDGTLADTILDLGQAMNGMLREFGWKERTREELIERINRGARLFVARSMPDEVYSDIDDDIVTKALAVYSEKYSKCYNDKTAPFDGVPELLASLKADSIRLGVLSNKQDEFVRMIAERLFPGTFDFVLGQGKYPEKPCPDAALAVAREFCCEPCECMFVGDSDIDMKTANNAKMYAMGVSWGYRSPEVLTAAGAAEVAGTPDDIRARISAINGKL